jgi:hypothetical protein
MSKKVTDICITDISHCHASLNYSDLMEGETESLSEAALCEASYRHHKSVEISFNVKVRTLKVVPAPVLVVQRCLSWNPLRAAKPSQP